MFFGFSSHQISKHNFKKIKKIPDAILRFHGVAKNMKGCLNSFIFTFSL